MSRPKKKSSKPRPKPKSKGDRGQGADTPPRIIGGKFGGRKLIYNGDPRTRPMKERTREATFNLVGPSIRGKHAVDLFAGTGALGLEALSRGALSATFIEQHFPTAAIIRQNAVNLDVEDRCQIVPGSAFIWAQAPNAPTDLPWVVFCSPPYAFYHERTETMHQLVTSMIEQAPEESIFVVEADIPFDFTHLPQVAWDIRCYSPARMGIWRKKSEEGAAKE